MFFEYLLPHVRLLYSQRKMLLRMKMQKLVYNFVYGNKEDNGSYVDIQKPVQTGQSHLIAL